MANDTVQDKLITYLEDAYALENQLIQTLEQHSNDAKDFPETQAMINQHLEETKIHRQRMEECLALYNKKPSGVKGVVSSLMGNLVGAVAGGRTDVLAKNARDEYTAEHLEIASYGLLITTAKLAGDERTVQACEANLRDEMRTAHLLEQNLAKVCLLAYQQDGMSVPQTKIETIQAELTQMLQSTKQQAQSEVKQIQSQLSPQSSNASVYGSVSGPTDTQPSLRGNSDSISSNPISGNPEENTPLTQI